MILTPPLQSNDEAEHFLRSYQISKAVLVPSLVSASNFLGQRGGLGGGGSIPETVLLCMNSVYTSVEPTSLKVNRNYDHSCFEPASKASRLVRFDNTSINSPTTYVGSATAIMISSLLSQPPLFTLYLARVGQLLVFIILFYTAAKLLPKGREFFFIFCLNPSLLFFAATTNPDALAVVFIGVLVACIWRVNSTEKLTRVSLVIITVFLCLVALLKVVFLPIVLLLLTLRSISKKKIILIAILSLVPYMLWCSFAMKFTSGIPSYFGIQDHMNSVDQIAYIFSSPGNFIVILLANLFGQFSLILPSATLDAVLFHWQAPQWATLVWLICLLIIATTYSRNSFTFVHHRWVNVVVALSIIALTVLTVYIGINSIGSLNIGGVQTKYYYAPILILLFGLLPLINTHVILRFSSSTRRIVSIIMVIAPIVSIVSALSLAWIWLG